MNNEIIAAITAGVEAYEGSKAFVVTKIPGLFKLLMSSVATLGQRQRVKA